MSTPFNASFLAELLTDAQKDRLGILQQLSVATQKLNDELNEKRETQTEENFDEFKGLLLPHQLELYQSQ